MIRTRYRFVGNDSPYVLTMAVVSWLPVFTRPDTAEILFESWRFLQREQGWRIHGDMVLEKVDCDWSI